MFLNSNSHPDFINQLNMGVLGSPHGKKICGYYAWPYEPGGGGPPPKYFVNPIKGLYIQKTGGQRAREFRN